MSKIRALNLLVVRAGPTVWDAQGLVAGGADVPLVQDALLHAKSTFGVLNGTAKKVAAVLCGPEQASMRIADLFAAYCGCQEQVSNPLREIRLGLWEGLPESDVAFRYPRMHRQWRADPTSVLTPGGESWTAAARRVMTELLAVAARKEDAYSRVLLPGGRNPGDSALIGVVVRPLLFGMLASGYIPGYATNGGDPSKVRALAMGSDRMCQVRILLDEGRQSLARFIGGESPALRTAVLSRPEVALAAAGPAYAPHAPHEPHAPHAPRASRSSHAPQGW